MSKEIDTKPSNQRELPTGLVVGELLELPYEQQARLAKSLLENQQIPHMSNQEHTFADLLCDEFNMSLDNKHLVCSIYGITPKQFEELYEKSSILGVLSHHAKKSLSNSLLQIYRVSKEGYVMSWRQKPGSYILIDRTKTVKFPYFNSPIYNQISNLIYMGTVDQKGDTIIPYINKLEISLLSQCLFLSVLKRGISFDSLIRKGLHKTYGKKSLTILHGHMNDITEKLTGTAFTIRRNTVAETYQVVYKNPLPGGRG